jgi:hypothetical protein
MPDERITTDTGDDGPSPGWITRLKKWLFEQSVPVKLPDLPPFRFAESPITPPPFEGADDIESWRRKKEYWSLEFDRRKNELEAFKIHVERYKANLDNEKIARDWHTLSSQAAFTHARAAINYAILLNGGSALALMSFLAARAKDGDSVSRIAAALTIPLHFLTAGLVAAASASALSYISQSLYTVHYDRFAGGVRIGAAAAWVMSMVAFVSAIGRAATAFT